jgi:hypothetical protein
MNDEVITAIFSDWYDSLPLQPNKFPARGAIGAALVVLEHLKADYNLDLDSHRAEKGQAQIRGLGGGAVSKILAEFGETRPFLSEGGRTNRGTPGAVGSLLKSIEKLKLDKASADDRNEVLRKMQGLLVEKVREFHGRQRIKFVFDPRNTTRQIVHEILTAAHQTGKLGPVAQYLVGAKLQLRFPAIKVSNDSYSTADVQLGRRGDFMIEDTAFHVTVAPMPAVYDKCKTNLDAGCRVYLLVPESAVVGARQNADLIAQGKIAVESIESFVGQNVEELSKFSQKGLLAEFLKLLQTYNQRVEAVESDKSMMIEIPTNLQPN